MKLFHYLSFLTTLTFVAGFAACDDKKSDEIPVGINNPSWTDGQPEEFGTNNTLSVQFQATAGWKAQSNATWCELYPSEGKAGKNDILLKASFTDTERTAKITIYVDGCTPASFTVKQPANTQSTSTNRAVNEKVNEYLRKMYLWNEEYKTLSLDFEKDYENFFYDALNNMTTNTLDRKLHTDSQGKPYYTLFSYIEKRNLVTETRAAQIEKELEYSFGITGLTPVAFEAPQGTVTILFVVQGTYPNSPAEAAGIMRGAMISSVNGTTLNESNYVNHYYDLLMPESTFSLKLEYAYRDDKQVTTTEITAKAMYCNPVIYHQNEKINNHHIGYLVYNGFEASFDEELFNVFKEFKTKQITDLVLDLRYNGGGHTISANLIASCIAGAASSNRIFANYRYNAERMKTISESNCQELFAYKRYANLSSSLEAGALNLKHVYCLVGSGTASASELVINALRGIDVEVTLIGEPTTGKNVGMEYEDMEINNDTYRVVPITFQTSNAKGFGEYENGFQPDIFIDETNPENTENTFYVHRAYGSHEESLYAKAIECITGQKPIASTRAAVSARKGHILQVPSIFRPGHDGMLMKRKTDNEK